MAERSAVELSSFVAAGVDDSDVEDDETARLTRGSADGDEDDPNASKVGTRDASAFPRHLATWQTAAYTLGFVILGLLVGLIGPALPALRELRASHNRLRALPEALGRAPALQELDVRQNELEELPESSFGGALGGGAGSGQKAPPLRVLLADGNRLRGLPGGFFLRFVDLHQVSLHGNPVAAADVERAEGFDAYEGRRRGKVDKGLAGGVLLRPGGFDEGLDRELLRA